MIQPQKHSTVTVIWPTWWTNDTGLFSCFSIRSWRFNSVASCLSSGQIPMFVMWSGYQGVLVYGLGGQGYGFKGFMEKDRGIKKGASIHFLCLLSSFCFFLFSLSHYFWPIWSISFQFCYFTARTPTLGSYLGICCVSIGADCDNQ